ncbi:unnamed protein product [Cuscuta europaea]|uniref:CCHC-type domain-containing protein n=1 Tax=Cuscuta europaea TaxID=41803 RepID=A0A9P0ZNA9_CUSEU|nr:unnamed protein product [Cuscuta europaea]
MAWMMPVNLLLMLLKAVRHSSRLLSYMKSSLIVNLNYLKDLNLRPLLLLLILLEDPPSSSSRGRGGRHSTYGRGSSSGRGTPSRASRPYLGTCQACRTQGHTARSCPLFRLMVTSSPAPTKCAAPPWPHHDSNTSWTTQTRPPWQSPQALTAPGPGLLGPAPSSPWIFDSGATHHLTSDLANFSLHTPYPGIDEVIVGNGSHHGGNTPPRSG